MSKYTLKTFYGTRELEKYEHRTPQKLRAVLQLGKFHKAGQTDRWGVPEIHPNMFTLIDGQREKIFEGNIGELLIFIKTLK